MTDKTAAQILTEAADVIDRNGWTQFRYFDTKQWVAGTPAADCRVCLYGALHIAMYGKPGHPHGDARPAFYHDMVTALEEALDGAQPDDWNDAEGRTQGDVTALLRSVAAKVGF
jgi:hypothetical protein